MKAVTCSKYGPPEVLKLVEIDKPVPRANEILVKIHATSVTSADRRVRGFDVPVAFWLLARLALGFFKPRNSILGVELSGEIEEVGKDVTKFKKGDQVFSSTYDSGSGGYAEYKCIPEDSLVALKPSNTSYQEAASVIFGAGTSLHFLRKGKIQSGQKILIYGASGCLGVYAVQLAKHFGAEVTGICSTANLDLVKSLGASKVIDYTKEDFSKSDEEYDIIYDTVGMSPFGGSVRSLKKNGFYLRAVHLTFSSVFRGIWTGVTTSKKVVGGVASESIENLLFIRKLMESGEIKSVIDKTYRLDQLVEAHKYVDKGHKRGSVVIEVVE